MSWWTVLALLLITYCDDYGQEILVNATNTTTNATIIDNTTIPTTTVLPETELTEGQQVVCEHHSWILLFTTLASIFWMVTGCLLMPVVLEQQALQEAEQRRQRDGGDTVATCDEDDEWEDVEMTTQENVESPTPHAENAAATDAPVDRQQQQAPGPEENERGNGIQPTENL